MQFSNPELLGMSEPDLGDARLNRRQVDLLAKLAEHPDSSVPEALANEARCEAFYRLVRNKRVDMQMMLQPHAQDVAGLVAEHTVVVAHDSTSIRHACARDADDVYQLKGGIRGYLAHASLAIVEAEARPVGVLHCESVERSADRSHRRNSRPNHTANHEGRRWARGVLASEAELGGRCTTVHVMDSEGDSYSTMMCMTEESLDFVVRAQQTTRLVTDDEGGTEQLRGLLPSIETVARRQVPLSSRKAKKGNGKSAKGKRNRSSREARTARISIGAMPARMNRAQTAPKEWPRWLELNVVRAWEPNPPAGQEPVDWVLWTTLPIDTEEQILRVVDIYRQRWLIEELFKALKTGCRFEKRRFESRATSTRALALYLPIAAHTLALRTLARTASKVGAEAVLPLDHIQALQASVPGLPRRLTVSAALLAVAKLGGHLKSNGHPGWLVLSRGMEKLHERAAMWRIAREHFANN